MMKEHCRAVIEKILSGEISSREMLDEEKRRLCVELGLKEFIRNSEILKYAKPEEKEKVLKWYFGQMRPLVISAKERTGLEDMSEMLFEAQEQILQTVQVELEVPEVLPEAPPLPRAPLPAQWVRRRPDVRAAELRVQAADRRVAAAVADQFPRLALAASADTTDQQIRSLLVHHTNANMVWIKNDAVIF